MKNIIMKKKFHYAYLQSGLFKLSLRLFCHFVDQLDFVNFINFLNFVDMTNFVNLVNFVDFVNFFYFVNLVIFINFVNFVNFVKYIEWKWGNIRKTETWRAPGWKSKGPEFDFWFENISIFLELFGNWIYWKEFSTYSNSIPSIKDVDWKNQKW